MSYYDEQVTPPTDRKTYVMMGLSAAVLMLALLFGVVAGIRGLSGGDGVGEPFAHFSGRTAAGDPINTEDFRGKVMVVDFWATWCPPCREKIPTMIAIQEEFGEKGVQVVGVSGDQAASAVNDYARSQGINFPTIFEGADAAFQHYKVRGIPTVMVVNREGIVTFRGHGGDIRAEVLSAL